MTLEYYRHLGYGSGHMQQLNNVYLKIGLTNYVKILHYALILREFPKQIVNLFQQLFPKLQS